MQQNRNQGLVTAQLGLYICKNSQGFTLLELLVVIVILGVLTSIAVPTVIQQIRRSRTAEAQAALSMVASASEVYRSDFGLYPLTYDEIKADGTYPAKYMDQSFSAFAPNYQDPNQLSTNTSNPALEAQGAIWQTLSDPAQTAYTNYSNALLDCRIGQGVDSGVVIASNYYVKDGCNMSQ
jgi:type II secretion system protein G